MFLHEKRDMALRTPSFAQLILAITREEEHRLRLPFWLQKIRCLRTHHQNIPLLYRVHFINLWLFFVPRLSLTERGRSL